MKIRIVHFTPREGSRTKQLLDAVRGNLHGDVTERDLVSHPLAPLNTDMAGFFGSAEAVQERELLKEADLLILAFPTWNYSMPTQVKTWVDAVAVANETFSYVGPAPMAGKKVLIVNTAGTDYETMPFPETAVEAARNMFERLMKLDVEVLRVWGTDSVPAEEVESRMVAALQKAAEIGASYR